MSRACIGTESYRYLLVSAAAVVNVKIKRTIQNCNNKKLRCRGRS